MAHSKVPKILEERLLIDDDDRELLSTLDRFSPNDNSKITVTPSIFDFQVPTLKQVADSVGKSKKEVWEHLQKIRKVWGVPEAENLPTNNGFFDQEDALINALTNQHRLRWDEEREDYRVPKVHLMEAELGLGQLYTNNDAFMGERIFRKATGIDDVLNSVHIQGGVMPEMIRMYGAAKHYRALMTGLDKTGNGKNEAELDRIKQVVELMGHSLSQRDKKNLEENVIDTLDSLRGAAYSVALEIAPLLDVEEEVPVHIYFGPSDFANIKEIRQDMIAKKRVVNRKMQEYTERLPAWRRNLRSLRDELHEGLIDKLVSDRIYTYTNAKVSQGGEEAKRNGEFRRLLNSFFETQRGSKTVRYSELKNNVRGKFEEITGGPVSPGVDEEWFDSVYYAIVNKIREDATTHKRLRRFYESGQEEFNKRKHKISDLEDKISEAEKYENDYIREGFTPSFFTSIVAMTPTEAKTLAMLEKDEYQRVYNEILVPEIKRIVGKDLNIRVHTDNLITTHVPDPQDILEGRAYDPDTPIGTLFTSNPQTNIQRSNEPLNNSMADLEGFHAGEIANAVKAGRLRPRTVEEFEKRDYANSDVLMTSYGSDGFMHQPKFTVGPTRAKGEFSIDPRIVQYFKLTSRHDTKRLGELMAKGNIGTWAAKRLVKGGATTGNTYYIEHADRSFQPIFVDDKYYEQLNEKFGRDYQRAEEVIKMAPARISRVKKSERKKIIKEEVKRARQRIEAIHEEVRPVIYNILQENDLHLGGYSAPGRVSLVDGIVGSQLAAVQAIGTNNIQYAITTEAFNGDQAWHSYMTSHEGGDGSKRSSSEFMRDLRMIEERMRSEGYPEREILDSASTYVKEFIESKPDFLSEEQIGAYDENLVPINTELMNKGMKFYSGTGNHWMSSKEGNINEGTIVAGRYPRAFVDQGKLILGKEASGQSFSYELVKLPSVDGEGIYFDIAHKMNSGRTEISEIAKQLVGTRTPAIYSSVADRHHAGVGAERGKMFTMDNGKQPDVPYVQMIGKVASTRGTMVTNYGANGELLIGARYFADPVMERVTGWKKRAGILNRCKSFLEEVANDTSLLREKREIDYRVSMDKGRYSAVEEKYGGKKD